MARPAERLFHRPRTGEPFYISSFYVAQVEHDDFMLDQIPAVRSGLWSLIDEGWQPGGESQSTPKWEILPRRWRDRDHDVR